MCILLSTTAIAQTSRITNTLNDREVFLRDANGIILRPNSNMTVLGSPYFSKEYCIANIKVQRGRKYNGLEVKLNLQSNRLVYRMSDGEELEPNVPIDYVEFTGCDGSQKTTTFRTGFPPVDKHDITHFYQVLDSGQTQLLKSWNINFMDQTPYGGTGTTRTYEAAPTYYAYSSEKGMVALGKGNEKTILTVLSDKSQQVNKYINDQNIRLKKEEDMVKLFNYYNSSPKP